MKNKVLSFIIGVLVGAIVATAGYYFYAKNNVATTNNVNENRPEIGDMQNMPEPPEMSNSTNKQKPDDMQGEPPAKPDEEKENSTSNKNEKKNDTKSNEVSNTKSENKVNN